VRCVSRLTNNVTPLAGGIRVVLPIMALKLDRLLDNGVGPRHSILHGYQLKAQGPSRTCNESKEGEEGFCLGRSPKVAA